ncbi:hypothetical protein AVEN_139253-1 [Araneus ventricosus]|uniref:Uncharacterized protein n=1 Tax=Araneus ventricosus TaxID=182803 RepID=A0A4Y2MDF8_ARAVE|nr:hypothetical protein AVEN_139253-1 [Araneus ventricosus]
MSGKQKESGRKSFRKSEDIHSEGKNMNGEAEEEEPLSAVSFRLRNSISRNAKSLLRPKNRIRTRNRSDWIKVLISKLIFIALGGWGRDAGWDGAEKNVFH